MKPKVIQAALPRSSYDEEHCKGTCNNSRKSKEGLRKELIEIDDNLCRGDSNMISAYAVECIVLKVFSEVNNFRRN